MLDPVRHLTNPSSGKMGYALARIAKRRGAKVTLISGPNALIPPSGIRHIQITSAQEMEKTVVEQFRQTDAVIMAAAVSDYRPKKREMQKIKKMKADESVGLEKTTDILLHLGGLKQRQVLVGFAAETENVLENAKSKLRQKNLDFIVANDLTADNAGFGSDTNEVTILWPGGEMENLPSNSKEVIAMEIWDRVERLWQI
jgi:phosphopantothenoylcysteine decarboxylase/phosphopantothenate--cysteine ligase